MSLIVNERKTKTSALKEEIWNIHLKKILNDDNSHELKLHFCSACVDIAIRKTQEADNILMKKDADTIHNQRIELLKLQSKIKELEEARIRREKDVISPYVQEKLKIEYELKDVKEQLQQSKSETIRKVKEMIDRLAQQDYFDLGFPDQEVNARFKEFVQNFKQQIRRL